MGDTTKIELPKLYRVVLIEFWSLRMGGGLEGAIFDCDIKIKRKCRRVLTADGDWKWQLADLPFYFDEWHFNEIDQECLDEGGSDMWGVEVLR